MSWRQSALSILFVRDKSKSPLNLMVYINQLSNRNPVPICYNVSHSNILEMPKKQNLTSPQNGLKSSLDQIVTAFPVLFGLL